MNWFFNTSDIIPGSSAVLNNNYGFFYLIYGTIIASQSISFISCLLVVIFVILSRVRKCSWDFSDRFPLFLALSDIIWLVPYLISHFLLINRKTYPSSETCNNMATHFWMFFGYQQTMNVGLVLYMYLKVVWQKQIYLGRGEWKLHGPCIATILLSIAVFYPMGSFGCSGFWYNLIPVTFSEFFVRVWVHRYLHRSNSTNGLILGYYTCISCAVQALCTTFGYRSILKVIEAQKKLLSSGGILSVSGSFRHHSVATECLTTYVRIAEILYCTLAIAAWALAIEVTLGVQEPITVLVTVVTGNSSGLANALGYFYNKRVKARKALKPQEDIPTASAFPSSN